ncbi:hypothetical protein AB0M43_15690 [Longispora sp. NPDC051575]|uniref:hypothetical protein n=1 Tax=Longispora sp. NPDC051575 TaxID=3154943 RepID=UPI00341BA13A
MTSPPLAPTGSCVPGCADGHVLDGDGKLVGPCPGCQPFRPAYTGEDDCCITR